MLPKFIFNPILVLFAVALCCTGWVSGQQLSGTVSDANNQKLQSASIYIKGSTLGTITNKEGQYFLPLKAGSYTIVCAYVGYTTVERQVNISQTNQNQDFILSPQQTELKEVIVNSNAEDAAYEIIRQTIAQRESHYEETKAYQALVYVKGLIKTRELPNRIFGIEVKTNSDVIDSNGRGIIYLSEALTKYARSLPNNFYEQVISAKVSGNSSGFGFNSPQDLEFNIYQNNIPMNGLGNRGFVSPISQNALHYYNYKYLGSFFEDGKEILKVKVMPKRKYEPLFAGGYIQITDGDWRVHSLNLVLTKESQIELVDSLIISQQYFPVGHNNIWMPQNTDIKASFGVLGIKADASFAGVFSNYDFKSDLSALFKSKIIKTIDTSANKKSVEYWDSIRPQPLTTEELNDYTKKAILEQKYKSPAYLDSMDKRRNTFGLSKFLIVGHEFIKRSKKMRYSIPPIINSVSYNTVEGWVADISPTFTHYADTGRFTIKPSLRYGFNNKHFNGQVSVTKTFGQAYNNRFTLGAIGGKYVFQINPSEPISPLVNTISTLLYTANYLKIYEKAYGQVNFSKNLNGGLRLSGFASYEDRMPLENTDTTYKWKNYKGRSFRSNYPEEITAGNFERHQAFITQAQLRFQPGHKYVQYPDRLISVGSDEPVFKLTLAKAWSGVFGSDANWGKWEMSVVDDFNMKLGGSLNYNLSAGGFINNKNVQLPDWKHFTGNQTISAGPYVSSYQLAPYYANSTKDGFYSSGHVEWHLNGLLTNKIPLFRKFNWHLVTGSNAFYVDKNRHYVEYFIGIENIFKVFRVDWVTGYDATTNKTQSRIIIGGGGLFGQ